MENDYFTERKERFVCTCSEYRAITLSLYQNVEMSIVSEICYVSIWL